MNVSPLFIFILGVLIGFLLALYIFQSSKPSQQPSGIADIKPLLEQQMAYTQLQNAMRDLQLHSLRQEQEFRQLEQQRNEALAKATRLNAYDLRTLLGQQTGDS